MEIRRCLFEANGEEVIKVTDGQVTGYIAASIPHEALQIWHRRFGTRLERMNRLRFPVRLGKHPRSKPRRVHTHRRRPQKRYRGHRRYWTGAPQR